MPKATIYVQIIRTQTHDDEGGIVLDYWEWRAYSTSRSIGMLNSAAPFDSQAAAQEAAALAYPGAPQQDAEGNPL